MKTYAQSLIIVVICFLTVSISWSASLPVPTKLPPRDLRPDANKNYTFQPESEELYLLSDTETDASIKTFSVGLNSESAPIQMQFYESTNTAELVIDLSGIPGLTDVTIQKTEFNDPQSDVSSEQIKIRFSFEGANHEFLILGEAGGLPNLRLTDHLSAQRTKPDDVIQVKQWLGFHDRQKRMSDDESVDRFNGATINETDNSDQDDTGFRVLEGISVTVASLLASGQFLWIVGNTKLPKNVPETYEPFMMALRLFSYIVGLGIPLFQELLIRAIYVQVKNKSLDTFWIPACGY